MIRNLCISLMETQNIMLGLYHRYRKTGNIYLINMCFTYRWVNTPQRNAFQCSA